MPARLDIGPGPLDPVSAQVRSTRHWPEPLDQKLIWVCSAQHSPMPARPDVDLGLLDSGPLGPTSTRARSARNQPLSRRFDIGPRLLDSISDPKDLGRHGPGPAQLDIGSTRLCSTLAQADSARYRLWSTRFNIGLGPLGTISSLARLTRIISSRC